MNVSCYDWNHFSPEANKFFTLDDPYGLVVLTFLIQQQELSELVSQGVWEKI